MTTTTASGHTCLDCQCRWHSCRANWHDHNGIPRRFRPDRNPSSDSFDRASVPGRSRSNLPGPTSISRAVHESSTCCPRQQQRMSCQETPEWVVVRSVIGTISTWKDVTINRRGFATSFAFPGGRPLRTVATAAGNSFLFENGQSHSAQDADSSKGPQWASKGCCTRASQNACFTASISSLSHMPCCFPDLHLRPVALPATSHCFCPG